MRISLRCVLFSLIFFYDASLRAGETVQPPPENSENFLKLSDLEMRRQTLNEEIADLIKKAPQNQTQFQYGLRKALWLMATTVKYFSGVVGGIPFGIGTTGLLLSEYPESLSSLVTLLASPLPLLAATYAQRRAENCFETYCRAQMPSEEWINNLYAFAPAGRKFEVQFGYFLSSEPSSWQMNEVFQNYFRPRTSRAWSLRNKLDELRDYTRELLMVEISIIALKIKLKITPDLREQRLMSAWLKWRFRVSDDVSTLQRTSLIGRCTNRMVEMLFNPALVRLKDLKIEAKDSAQHD